MANLIEMRPNDEFYLLGRVAPPAEKIALKRVGLRRTVRSMVL